MYESFGTPIALGMQFSQKNKTFHAIFVQTTNFSVFSFAITRFQSPDGAGSASWVIGVCFQTGWLFANVSLPLQMDRALYFYI